MLSTNSTETIKAALHNLFPERSTRTSKESGAVESITVVVDEIDTWQLSEINDLSTQAPNGVKLKRSGTGISIRFS